MAENLKPNNTAKIIIIVVGIVLASALGYFMYSNYQLKEQLESLTVTNDELEVEIDNLEEDIQNLETKIQNKDIEIDEKNLLIEEQQKEIEQQKKKLNALASAGKLKDEELKKYMEKVDQLNYYIQKYQKEVEELKQQVNVLTAENDTLKKDVQELTYQNQTIEKENMLLTTQVTAAAVLKAVDFAFISVKGDKEDKEDEFKANRLKELVISFNILENVVAQTGERKIFVVYKNPDGSILKDMGGQGGKFSIDGKEMIYSCMKTINYDKSTQKVSVQYKKPKDADFQKGKQTVEVYCDGFKIGTGSFNLK